MTLEQAMRVSPVNSAFRHPISGGVVIVDGVCGKDGDYWVQQQFQIVRQHYSSLEEVKEVVSDKDDWQPNKEE